MLVFQKVESHSIAIYLLILIFGIFLGWYTTTTTTTTTTKPFSYEKNSGYKFTNHLLECGDLDNLSNRTVSNLKISIQELLNKKINSGDIKHASVYFRDLNNGPWFGINEKNYFIPSSLMKVPLMISIFKKAEKQPEFLKKVIYYGSEIESTLKYFQYFKPRQTIQPGNNYTVEDLVESMIKYSDNDAFLLLLNLFSNKELGDSYYNLGIDTPNDNQYTMQVKTYASFFRILYNATYLNQDYSEKALGLLSKTDFRSGLAAGVPKKALVAHKFGERDLENDLNQLHDCGIIYYPDKPYVLCVMTKGKDLDKMAEAIKDISKKVYDAVDEF